MTDGAEEDVLRCAFGDGKRGTKSLKVEGQGVLVVCTPCNDALFKKDKRKRCQYCGIPIKRDWKKSALDGFQHQPNCPRTDVVEVSDASAV